MSNKPMLSACREHCLKIHRKPFFELESGAKTGEIRDCSDRDFQVGDSVLLMLVDETGNPTPNKMRRKITHIQTGYGLPDDLCVLSYEPAAQHQGEPVTIQAVAVTRDDEDEGLRLEWLLEGGIAEMEFEGMMLFALPEANDLCNEDGSAEIYLSPQQEKHNAPVSVVLPFAEKIISKLRRFDVCASDNQDADIGRHWFDLLTQLGLLNRVQRSPALWEMTQQGEDALEATRLNTPQ